MTAPIDLVPFTGIDDFRDYLNAPWRRDGKLYATNGHFMIELADDGRDVPAYDKHPNCTAQFDKRTPGTFGALPEIPPAEPCSFCNGKGMCYHEGCPDCDAKGEFQHGMHDYECKRCDGDGWFTFPETPAGEKPSRCAACDGFGEEAGFLYGTKVVDQTFANRLLRVVSRLPDVEVAECSPNDGLWFKFDGGRGLVMSFRNPA